MSFDMALVGLDRFAADLARLADRLTDGVADGLKRDLDGVLDEAKELVPVDTGRLRDSGFVDEPAQAGAQVATAIGFDTPYATKVHEDLNMRHPHGGQAKFLESVLHQWAEGGPERIVKRALGSLR